MLIRERATRYERLASLTTLAAGAAHELGTPLATIAVVATEVERVLDGLPATIATPLRDDVRLIRGEVMRCRQILDAMATDAGSPQGEPLVAITSAALVAAVVEQLPAPQRRRLQTTHSGPALPLNVPRDASVQALMNLVRNGLDASTPDTAVHLRVSAEGPRARFDVQDHGSGMSPTVLARCTEPFFSTKPTGRGMGLGLFLAKSLAEHLGGTLTIDSVAGNGVTATLSIPVVHGVEGRS